MSTKNGSTRLDKITIIDNILINTRAGCHTIRQRDFSFKEILNTALQFEGNEWYLIEYFLESFQTSEESLELESDFFEILRKSGCQRIVYILETSLIERLRIHDFFNRAPIICDAMPNIESAFSWIQYLRIRNEPPITYSPHSTY